MSWRALTPFSLLLTTSAAVATLLAQNHRAPYSIKSVTAGYPAVTPHYAIQGVQTTYLLCVIVKHGALR